MSVLMQINPFDFFTDQKGDALDGGYIWIGQPDKDPQSFPSTVYYNSDLTIPAAQPLRTNAGYVVRNNAPAFLYIDGTYSVKVLDKKKRMVYYLPNVLLSAAGAAVSLSDLLNSTNPAKGAGLVGWRRSALATAITNVGQMLSAQPVNIWEFAQFVTTKPTPSNPATWDWSPALQAAVDDGIPVTMPIGEYPLFTPVFVKGGTAIFGAQGQGVGFQKGTILKPTTSAFLSSDFGVQQVFFRLADVGIYGGTTAMDLGLFHEVDMTDVSFNSFSVGALVLVRGEKHRFERIRFDAQKPGVFGMSVGRWEESPGHGYSDAYFAPNGAFFDRASLKDIFFQGGAGGYFAYAIKSNLFSSTDISNIVCHNNKQAGEISALYIRTRIQLCNIAGFAPDNWGNSANPCPALFDLAQVLSCTFANVSPSFAGNNEYTNGIRMKSAANTLFAGCWAAGDNVTKFGFITGTGLGQSMTMVSCRGAFFHSSVSLLARQQTVHIGCQWDAVQGGSGNYNFTNTNIDTMIMADTNGAIAATALARWNFANGGGAMRTAFTIAKEGPGSIGPLFNLGSNTAPEGKITANPGSLYLYNNGAGAGGLWVKQSGTGNTGWVAK